MFIIPFDYPFLCVKRAFVVLVRYFVIITISQLTQKGKGVTKYQIA